MPTLVKPSSSFLFILVSLDFIIQVCHLKRQKGVIFKNKFKNLMFMVLICLILQSYR